ncbi:glutamate 5-kinase [Brevibacillus reuszeri]|uniref:Glutamate 5-kinase n=1 Tax=Brevibacillus reuszeri TaxID=54915 RepID=A0A0K9YM23_9BACL|nr:glutamate 5-kinase [Brevibacillus reuszeri]KNB69744.1 gamma-glutamyl kinase [Brevibacillus reuszeri]MED1858086.1 glutamate 5-kinase [Brevibacillus reuszeri]GED68922.1 glutamate 5-kinase [Brevibacillus reuszeri]
MKKGKMRLVVKVGSSSLAAPSGGVDPAKMSLLVNAVSQLREAGHQVVLVSSGAVASGYQSLGYKQRPRTLAAKQASAAIGQSLLMQTYTQLFAAHRFGVAQILLTRGDFSNRERYQHAFQTLSLLLDKNILPIINENDTVSVAELTFGDNDMLGALVAGLVHADLYLILTDTNGLYDKDPRNHPDATRIAWLPQVTEEIEALAGGASQLGTGGMRSKLIAAKTAQGLGIPSFIGKLEQPSDLLEIVQGNGNGTYVSYQPEAPATTGLPTRKQWIALHSPIRGSISIDSGAAEAILEKRRSLLLAGVRGVDGTFSPGDVVEVYCDGALIGRGVSRYDAADLAELLLPAGSTRHSGTVIHRDHWTQIT